MNGGGSGGGGGGGGEERPKEMNKKGMWTLEEDEILTEYVRRHGEGNWNAVPRHTPLLRSGKSCRLRWANHLRPDLKKGAFSPEEENLVVQLHAECGNRWAHMASLLPGRTDNEIKNYWNTRMKRIRRAYLPMYPRRSHGARSTESSPSGPSLAVGNSQPPPPFFGPSSSRWSWPGPGQFQRHQLPPQSTIAGLRHHLSAFCAESHPPSRGANVVLPSIQITPPGAMVPSSGGACGFFPMPSEQSMSGLLGNLFGESETLAQKEMEKNRRESLGGDGAEAAASSSLCGEPFVEPINENRCMDDGLLGGLLAESETLAPKEMEKYLSESLSDYHAEVTYQATSSSFGEYTQLSGGAPTEEQIDEIKCMDDGLLRNLLAEFETLVPKEMEKNHGENLSGHRAEAAYEATSTPFMEYTQFSGGEPTGKQIDEIDGVDNGLLENLLAESETLALNEMKKNQSDSWGAYHVEAANQATSSSFNEHTQFPSWAPTEEPIDEIKCMDDGLLGNLLAEFETLVPKEMEKNHGENLSGHCAEAVYEATSTSFTEYTQIFGGEPTEKQIDEIDCVDNGLLRNLLAESETLALNEMKKNQSDSWSAYHVEAADQATSSSFNEHIQFSGGVPTEVPIDKIKCMDDDLLGNLLAEFETLVPKEMEKNHGENLSGHRAEAAYEATSTSFTEYTQFSGGEPTEKQIDEIDGMDNGPLGNLLAESETLALNEMKKNQSDNWSAYHVEAADQAISSSFNEHIQFSGEEPIEEPIDESECMDDGLFENLLAECETLALKEMEKNQSESLSGYRAKAVDQATSSSFSKHTQFSGAELTKEPIAEIERMDNGLLGDLLAEPETLALKEMEKNKSDSSSGYPMEVADQAIFSSFGEYTQFSGGEATEEPMDEIHCMNLLGFLSSFTSTMPSPDW